VTARTGILIARTGEPARPNVLICTVAGQSKLDPTAAPNEYLRTGRPPVSVTDRDPISAQRCLCLRTCCVNNVSRYHGWVLRSFRDKDTEAIWHRRRSRKLDLSLQRAAWRKLAMLDAAETLADLVVPPGNRLEKLAGDRAGRHGIRINRQWRICFRWTDAGARGRGDH
jgi:proteic killer suppression protein